MPEHAVDELRLLEVTADAQRRLLRARRPEEIVRTLERAVLALGGEVVPGHVGGDEVLHLDLALGVHDARLPWAPPDDPARARIQRVLPGLLEDARRLIHLLWAREDRDDPTLHDELTGALHAGATARLVERARPEDVLVTFEVGDADAIEHVHGPGRVDVLIRQAARFVRSELDVDERLGRLTGPTVLALLPHPEPGRARELTDRVLERWERQRALPVQLLATARPRGDRWRDALAAFAAPTDDHDEVVRAWPRQTTEPT